MLTTMLVDDNAFFRKVVRDDLWSRFPSMKITEASNAVEAFKELASNPTDLIFMDISLPGKDGITLTKEIKVDNRDIAVVMLSSYDMDEYRQAAFQSGANGFIGKGSVDLFGNISTVVNCFHEAKEMGRLMPGCLLISSIGSRRVFVNPPESSQVKDS